MPTYGYECKSCGHTFEAFQSMSDDPIKVCPACGNEVRRLINGGMGIIFKGSGFYVTDKGKGGSVGGSPSKPPAKPSSTESSGGAPADKSAGSPAPAGAAPPASGGVSPAGSGGDGKAKAAQPAKS